MHRASPVLLTDLPALKELIQHNLSLNRFSNTYMYVCIFFFIIFYMSSSVISSGKCTVAPLVWGDKEQEQEAIKVTGGKESL